MNIICPFLISISGYGTLSPNPGYARYLFHITIILWEKVYIILFYLQLLVNSRADNAL